MKASWRRGYRAKVSADVAAKELDSIKEKNGGVLTAGLVVLKAKPKSSPLHKAFEWNDVEAAEQYRLEQARNMLRAIEVIYPEQKSSTPTRKYHVVKEPEKNNQPERNVYKTTQEILQDPVARDELLASAIREAIFYRKKYAALSELAGVFTAMDDFFLHAESV